MPTAVPRPRCILLNVLLLGTVGEWGVNAGVGVGEWGVIVTNLSPVEGVFNCLCIRLLFERIDA